MRDTLPEFLQPLYELNGSYPLEAVHAAIERREESVPYLLRALELELEGETPFSCEEGGDYLLHIFALYILGYLREERAKDLALAIARRPEAEEILGDVVTDELGGILAHLCMESPADLYPLIEDGEADEYARSAGLEALGALHRAGRFSREALSGYLAELYASKLEREPSMVWNAAIELSASFAMLEHLEAVREAYADGCADEFFDLLVDVEAALRGESDSPRACFVASIIGHPDDEMQDWHCFSDKLDVDDDDDFESSRPMWDFGDADSALEPSRVPLAASGTVRRDAPKVGRNDPCSCGSGKKHKKCCG